MLIIHALQNLTQENHKVKDNLSYMTTCLKKKKVFIFQILTH